MTTTTNHYDLIVLGADVAGLVAAALVARRGKRVLVLPHGPVEGSYRLAGRVLPYELAPVIHTGTPPVERVLHELGLVQQMRRLAAPVSGFVHHVLPDDRLDVEAGERNLAGELARAWPDDPTEPAWALRRRWAEATDNVLDELLASDGALQADGFWGRRFLSRLAGQLPPRGLDELEGLAPGHGLRAIATAPLPWLSHLTLAQLGKAAALRIGRLWSAGPDDVPAGERRIRELLLQRIELHSGELKRELRVAELLVKRGKVVGVSLLGKRDRYGCDHLIVATDPRSLLDKTVLGEAIPRTLVHELAQIAPAAHRYVLHLEVDERGLTPAFDGMALCAPLASSPHGVGHMLVRCEPAASESLRRISISRIVAADEPLHEMRERCLNELDERGVLPFVGPWIRMCHSPHDGREIEDGAGAPLGDAAVGSAMNATMPAVYFTAGEPLLGVGLLASDSGVRGLHFASRVNLPGLGLEGEFAAGAAAAAMVAAPAKSPLSRSSLVSKA